jgi:hypothetical protein
MRPTEDAADWEERGDKLAFSLANVVFAFLWLTFCIHLARRWHITDVHLRSSALTLAILFIALWQVLLHEKNSGLCMIFACSAFWMASSLALRMF